MRVVKRQSVMEAYRWFRNGDHPQDYLGGRLGLDHGVVREYTAGELASMGAEGWVVRRYRQGREEDVCRDCGGVNSIHGQLVNGVRVCPGDWVIGGIEVCKPGDLEGLYEAV